MKLMKRILMALAALYIAGSQASGDLVVDNAWIREAPPGAKALAGYMELHNNGDKPRILVAAESDAFADVMLHRTMMESGMAKMVHQHMIEIPSGGMVSFEPNGYHLMLMKPNQGLKAGDKVDITLRFKDGESLKVTHEVRAAIGAMGGMDHSGKDHGAVSHDGMDHGAMQH